MSIPLSRRAALGLVAAPLLARSLGPLKPIIVRVHVLFDRGAHSLKGLDPGEIARFNAMQEKARREYSVSGIRFEIQTVDGAYLRKQGYSVIPDQFLARGVINLFVTDSLAYDVDHGRTGGSSTGPRPRVQGLPEDPYYKTYLGLREASDGTLAHEYAHHFCLDTQRRPTAAANLWADLRIDYWLWRQRHGVPILAFRSCEKSEWARLG
jgi:hypothetical protein